MNCIRFLVSGKVQGVFFRQNTYQVAKELALTGYVRNLVDGRVEVVACGEANSLEELKKWLWEGPAYAEVDMVQVEACEPSEFSDFQIIRS